MKTMERMTRNVLLALSFASVSPLARAGTIPKGWSKEGTTPQLYDVDVVTIEQGKSAALLRSVGTTKGGFGTLMQTISSAAYAGKRLRLMATVKADDVSNWAGLWMRVDGVQGKVLAFDNMMKRPIQGTAAPRKYAVVLDVPKTAQSISYGILLNGNGGAVTIWDVRVEAVGKEVPLTSASETSQDLPSGPQNLDFSE